MIQIITGGIIIIIGGFVFSKYPLEKNVKMIALGALFVVLTAILKRMAIMIPLFGVPALKVGFEIIPLMLAGMVLTPGYAFIVAIAVDVVGLIVAPTEFPFLGFTLNTVLMTCIPSLLLDTMKQINVKKLEIVIKVVSVILSFSVIGYISVLDTVTIASQVITMTLLYKIGIIIVVVVWSVILWLVLLYMERKVDEKYKRIFYIWVIAVMITEIGVTFFLTPYWLQVMYEIPFMISLFVRVVKQCIMIPVDIIVGYQLLKALKRIV